MTGKADHSDIHCYSYQRTLLAARSVSPFGRGTQAFKVVADKVRFSTECFHVQTGTWNVCFVPAYWIRVEDFLLERGLVKKRNPLYTVKNIR